MILARKVKISWDPIIKSVLTDIQIHLVATRLEHKSRCSELKDCSQKLVIKLREY